MSTRVNINEYFENILNALKSAGKETEAFSRLQNIADEVKQLEIFVKRSFETLDNHFQAYVQQINLFSSLIEFQRKVIFFDSPEKMIQETFEYIKSQINYDGAFIHLKINEKSQKEEDFAADPSQIDVFHKFLKHDNGLQKIRKIIRKIDLGILLKDVSHSEFRDLPWHVLKAKSVIIFPLRVQNNLFGFGLIYSQKAHFQLQQLSFINLLLGLFSLLIFQHFYFFELKKRYAEQAKFYNIFEKVKFAQYFDKGPLCIYSLDESGVILHVNNSALENKQIGIKPAIGEKFSRFLPENQQTRFNKILQHLKPGDIQTYQLPMFSQNGSSHVWNLILSKIEIKKHFHLNILFAVDITNQYYHEQTVRRNEILEQISGFSELMNNDLNALLTVLIPNVSAMQIQLPPDHALQKNLQVMQNALEQSNQLVKAFLNYNLSDIEQPRRLNINKLVLSVAGRIQETLPKMINVQFSLAPDVPPMPLYPKRMAQLLKIFIQNSREALGEMGDIRVSTRKITIENSGLLRPQMFFLPGGTYIELAVKDNGKGIKKELIPHIFKPFFSTKIQNHRSGLGLFVAYKIVRDLHGEIYVESIPDKSTTFYVYLPVKGERQMLAKAPGKVATQNGKSAPFILVVDDEFNIRNILKEIFEMNGFNVLTAENGKEGVELFEQHAHHIDLVILDMVMPVMNGRQAFKEIKKRKHDQKVIIISGYLSRDELQEILADGAIGFISKPFQIEDIINKVKNVLVH